MSISDEVRSCVLCPLSAKLDSGFKPLPGTGRVDAKILVVYDKPTYDDYLSQQYLTSREGLLFDKMLAKCELSRKEVYITPLIKCYAACATDVTASVEKTCGDWLIKQRAALKPLVIVPCGRSSIAKILARSKNNLKLDEVTKKFITVGDTMIICLPALFSLFNVGNSTFNYHCDRLLEGKKWVSSHQINMEKAVKS
jgi:uracil-DNA glycosylase family 4